MLLMFIVYNNAVDTEIVELVKQNASGYTKFISVQGEGNKEPNLGTHIWPSINNCIMVALENTKEKNIAKAVDKLKKEFPGIGISIFTTELKKMI